LTLIWSKTPVGIWVRFAGEHPQALDAAGLNVNRIRWAAVILSGMLAALAGVTLSVGLSSSFSRSMTAGRGFMALAAVIFGKWKPVPTALACLLFGFLDAVQMRMQGVQIGGVGVPVQFIQVLPYIATVIVLAGFIGRARAPRSLGLPFEKV
jgi:simple sugar transport system permease protein